MIYALRVMTCLGCGLFCLYAFPGCQPAEPEPKLPAILAELPWASQIVPYADARKSVIEVPFVKTLLPKTWLDDPDRPYVLLQHYPLLTAEKVTGQRDAFASDYGSTAADSVNRLYIYSSDKYYKMHFDGGRHAHLIDKRGRDDLDVFQGDFTVLIHLPTGQILGKEPALMDPYLLCDWLIATKQVHHPAKDLGWTRRQPQLRKSLGDLNERPHRGQIRSKLLDTLAASVPIYSIPTDSIGSDVSYVMLDAIDIVQIPMPDTTSERRFFNAVSLDDRRLVISDMQNERMELFSYPGFEPLKRWPRGSLPGEFNRPTLLEAANGQLIVNDQKNGRIQWLDENFEAKALFRGYNFGSTHGHVLTNKGVARLYSQGSDSTRFETRFAVYPPDKSPLRVLEGNIHEVPSQGPHVFPTFPSLTGNGRHAVVYSTRQPYLWIYDGDLNLTAVFSLSGAYVDVLFELGKSSQRRQANPIVEPHAPFFQWVHVDHNHLLHAKLDAGTLLVIDLESLASGSPEWHRFHFSTEALHRMGLGLKQHPRLLAFETVRTMGEHTLVFRKMDDRIFRYPSVKLAFSRFISP